MKTGALALFMIFVNAYTLADDLELGEARCDLDMDIVNPKCRVTFNLRDSAYYHIQRLSEGTGRWEPYGDHNEHLRQGDVVPPAAIYRVAACRMDAASDDDDCKTSKVFWAPMLVRAENIPERIFIDPNEKGDGRYAIVSKNFPQRLQLLQYNVYLLSAYLAHPYMNTNTIWEEMTPPSSHEHHDESKSHLVYYVNYEVYSAYSKLVKSIEDSKEGK